MKLFKALKFLFHYLFCFLIIWVIPTSAHCAEAIDLSSLGEGKELVGPKGQGNSFSLFPLREGDQRVGNKEVKNKYQQYVFSFTSKVTFEIKFSYKKGYKGVLLEIGGGKYGTIAYVYKDRLTVRSGKGGKVNAVGQVVLSTKLRKEGTHVLVCSIDAKAKKAKLYFNGKQADTFTRKKIAIPLFGKDLGAVGRIEGAALPNKGGFTRRSEGYTGKVESCRLWKDKTFILD